MRANVPKQFNSLSSGSRQKIVEYAQDVAREQTEHDMRIVLDLYIKMVCVTLHDAFGFGEKRLTYFLGCHRRLFYRQRRMVSDGTQIEYLNRRMAEIFRKDGFPQDFFDKMLGAVELPEEEKRKSPGTSPEL